MRDHLKILMALSSILMILAVGLGSAATIELSGDAGKAILQSLVNSTSDKAINANQTIDTFTNQTNNASARGLWSWGTPPAGYAIDKSGNLVSISSNEDWVPGI